MANPSEADRAFEAYRDTRFFASLDGLRFICIALVLWHHSPLFAAWQDTAPILFKRGFNGVNFFFVLSGYLITTLLLREEDRAGRFSLRGFYRRRFLRIVPVYFLVVTLASIWFVLIRGREDLAELVPYYYLFLANFLVRDIPFLAPTWSLAVEEQYYLMWPLLLLMLPQRPWLRAGLVVALVVYLTLCGMKLLPVPVFWETEVARFRLPVTGYSAILIGSLLGLVLHRRHGFAAVWRAVGGWWMPAILFLGLIWLWHVMPAGQTGWPNLVMHLLMAAILASLVVRPDHVLKPVLTLRPVARIGAISYGLYLWHMIGRHFAHEIEAVLGLPLWATTLVYLVLGVALAEASFRLFEVHFLRLKEPKARRPRPVTSRVAGPDSDRAG